MSATNTPWIFCTDPELQSYHKLSTVFHFPQKQVLEVLTDFEVPRIEKRRDKTVLYLRLPDTLNKSHRMNPRTLLIMYTEEQVAVIATEQYPFLAGVPECFREYKNKLKPMLIFSVIMLITNEYMKQIMIINDALQDQFIHFRSVDDSRIIELLKYDQLNSLYLSALLPIPQILAQVASEIKLSSSDEEYLESVNAKLRQAIGVCEATNKLIVSIRDSYQTIFTNSLSNKVKLLAGLTIILTIPNIIGSLWGMNVAVPFHNDPAAFWIIAAFSIIIALVVFLYLKWKKWI